jgi:hypothetical protein
LRICSNKLSNWFLINLKVSKIEFNINFVFFANNFVNFPKKGQKKSQKTEICSRKLVWHFTEKRYIFLGIGYRFEKNIDFGPIQTLLLT